VDTRLKVLINWIRKVCEPATGLLIPISGGSDSALTFWLCAQACPEKTLGIYIGKNLRCAEWFERVRMVVYCNLSYDFAAHDGQGFIPGDPEVLRWAFFQSLCSQQRRWLISSRNRTEHFLGTYSLASEVATVLPLSGVWKSEVMELCKLIGVPQAILDSSRRADPDCGRPQSLAEIPLETIDLFLQMQEDEFPDRFAGEDRLIEIDKAQRDYLYSIYQANKYKSFLPRRGPRLQGLAPHTPPSKS